MCILDCKGRGQFSHVFTFPCLVVSFRRQWPYYANAYQLVVLKCCQRFSGNFLLPSFFLCPIMLIAHSCARYCQSAFTKRKRTDVNKTERWNGFFLFFFYKNFLFFVFLLSLYFFLPHELYTYRRKCGYAHRERTYLKLPFST